MISVEVLSRHRDVVARYRSDASATTVGRAYDNDVVIDDPAVAAHHLRIFRDDGGRARGREQQFGAYAIRFQLVGAESQKKPR